MEQFLVTSLGYVGRGTIMGICHLGEYLVTGVHPDIAERIETLDIVNKVKIVDAYLEGLSKCRAATSGGATLFHKPLHVAVNSVSNAVERVHVLLEAIKTECDAHAMRYFHYWRTPNCLDQLASLEKLSSLLDQRLALTLQIAAQESILADVADGKEGSGGAMRVGAPNGAN